MSTSMMQEVDVTSWMVAEFEPAGLDEKVWLVEPSERQRWLFKPVTRHGEFEQGENWSEKIACEVSELLGLPVAFVEMARRNGRRGSISRNMVPRGWEIQPGAVLLSGRLSDYSPGAQGRKGHNLENIQAVLEGCESPLGFSGPSDCNAFDVFAGYLLLDAWIANRDRHDENWAVLREPLVASPPRLAPSYDHASSVGFNLRDQERQRRLREGSVQDFAQRGTAWRFEGGRHTTLVELATSALERAQAGARRHWLERLASVPRAAWESRIETIPGMSEAARMFVVELLDVNRRRLLHAH